MLKLSWNSFKSGQRCWKCKGGHKLEYDDIKIIVEQELNIKIAKLS